MKKQLLYATLFILLIPLSKLTLTRQTIAASHVEQYVSGLSSVHFAVIGDYGSAGKEELDVANQVKSWNPEFIVTVGDNNYSDGSASTIDANIGQYYHDFISPYTGSYGAGAATNRFFPVLGNHDWNTTNAQPYLNYFSLPGNERYYDIVQGPVHFFMLDSDSNEPDGVKSTSIQATWLKNSLSASSSPWNIVLLHHAPFSSSAHHGSNTTLQWPYEAWGADAVLAGHDHTYERITKGAIPYFVNGLGGKSIYSFGTPIAGSQLRYNGNYGAMLVDATDAYINFKFITRSGTVIDSYVLGTLPVVSVNLINRADADPTGAANVDFTVIFSESVAGVDVSDFVLTTSGVSGATVSGVSGSGSIYTVTVNTGSGSGTIRLDLVDDDTIKDVLNKPLGGVGAGNGDFTSGETYTIGESAIFADVPYSYWANSFIERLYNAGITGGCTTSPLNYCPDNTVTRAQMAVFLLKGIHGSSFTPPAVDGSTGFSDVATDYWAAAWIKQLAAEGITGGCGSGNYCPDATVTRAQMAVFLLKAKHGSNYSPPAVGADTGFSDVATDYWAAAFIKQLVAEGITSGCGSGNYCPDADVTRAQMAVFLVKAFNLP